MVFDKLAGALTKHYKMVLAIWIIALIISVPAILQVNSVISYNQTQSATANYESQHAQNVIAANFQRSVANGTLIILLQSDNITNSAARDFVLALQQRLASSTAMKDFQSMSSVYSYEDQIIEQTVMGLGPSMRPTEQNVSLGAFLLWGVPAVHAANWNASLSDSYAYNATSANLSAYLSQMHADANTTALAFGYYDAFAAAWNGTAISDPSTRATHCVQTVAPSFIGRLPADQAQLKAVLMAVLGGFNLTDFNHPAYIHTFSLGMIGGMASISNMTFLQEVYDLGPAPQPAAVAAYADSVVRNGTLATYPVAVPSQLVSSFVSSDDKSMLVMLSFSVTSDYTTASGDKPLIDDVQVVRNILSDLKSGAGPSMVTYVTGDAAISADMQTSSMNDMQLIEPITIIIIIVLMGLLFRSVLGQFLPLGAVGVALGISQAVVFVVGSTVAQVDSTTLTMLFTLLMAVGTDYSVFIIMRYREERIRGATREQAVHTSVTWAGESIVTSGATVIIAFFAMATSSFSMIQNMGLIFGLSVIVALLVALTLIPSILMLVGNRIFWPTTGERFKRFSAKIMQRKKEGNHGYFHRAASFAVKHAAVIVVAAVLVSVPTTYLFMTTGTSFDFIDSMGTPESVQGMNAMTADFGAGKIMPTQVVITGGTTIYNGTSFNVNYLNAIDNITATIAADPMVQQVTGVTRPYGQVIDYANLSAMPEQQRSQIVSSMLQSVGSDGKSVLLTVVLKDQPEKASTVNFIPTLRSELAEAKAQQPALASSTILVGGTSASLYDFSLDLNQQFTNIEIVVVIGIFIVMMIVLGSLLLPLFAVLSIAMSISWSFALTAVVFGSWLGKPILFIIPLILFIMLMGLGMDYNVFILTRIREEVHKGKEHKTAVIDAVDWTGGIITALALIMAGAFGSMMLSSNTMLMEFGFCLATGILLDEMFVRTYVVPAVLALIGKWAWWAPGWLQREGRKEKMSKKAPPVELDSEEKQP